MVSSAPRPPSWLSREARAEWRRVVPELDRLGMLGRIDRAVLTSYVQTWATYESAARALAAGELIVTGPHGQVVNPAWKVAREAQAQIRAWGAELGLSPSARGRMNLPLAPPPDPRRDDPLGLLDDDLD